LRTFPKRPIQRSSRRGGPGGGDAEVVRMHGGGRCRLGTQAPGRRTARPAPEETGWTAGLHEVRSMTRVSVLRQDFRGSRKMANQICFFR
jgi:hypothetical protein